METSLSTPSCSSDSCANQLQQRRRRRRGREGTAARTPLARTAARRPVLPLLLVGWAAASAAAAPAAACAYYCPSGWAPPPMPPPPPRRAPSRSDPRLLRRRCADGAAFPLTTTQLLLRDNDGAHSFFAREQPNRRHPQLLRAIHDDVQAARNAEMLDATQQPTNGRIQNPTPSVRFATIQEDEFVRTTPTGSYRSSRADPRPTTRTTTTMTARLRTKSRTAATVRRRTGLTTTTAAVVLALLLLLSSVPPPAADAAMSGGRVGGGSFSSSSSGSGRSSSSSSSWDGDGIVLYPLPPPKPDEWFDGYGPQIAIVGLNFVLNAVGIGALLYASFHETDDNSSPLGPGTSVLRMTVALDVPHRDDPSSILSVLNRLAGTALTDTRVGVHNLICEVAHELVRCNATIVSASASSQHYAKREAALRHYNSTSNRERAKFEHETVSRYGSEGAIDSGPSSSLSSALAAPAQSTQNSSLGNDNEQATMAVVTLLLAVDGNSTTLPAISSVASVEEALLRIANDDATVGTCLQSAEVLWTPTDRSETLTLRDVLADYPDLQPVEPQALKGTGRL